MPETAAKVAKAQVADAQEWLSHLPENVSNAIDDGLDATKRRWKRGKQAAEDLSEEALYRMKRHPVRSAAIALGVGMGVGVLLGWALTRQRHRFFW